MKPDERKQAEEILMSKQIFFAPGQSRYVIDAMIEFASLRVAEATTKLKERLKLQINTNDNLLLELKEATQRIIELDNQLNELLL